MYSKNQCEKLCTISSLLISFLLYINYKNNIKFLYFCILFVILISLFKKFGKYCDKKIQERKTYEVKEIDNKYNNNIIVMMENKKKKEFILKITEQDYENDVFHIGDKVIIEDGEIEKIL